MRHLYYFLISLFVYILTQQLVSGQGCTSGCTRIINVTTTPGAALTLTAADDNGVVCLQGTGTYTGTLNLNSRTEVTICIASGVTFSNSAATTDPSGPGLVVDNYGTWNKARLAFSFIGTPLNHLVIINGYCQLANMYNM